MSTIEQEATQNSEQEGAVEEGIEEEGHARIDDPILPPARHAKKGGLERDYCVPIHHPDRERTTAANSILTRLFDPGRTQRPELWTHIKLVAPGPVDQPPPDCEKWKSKHAVAAYCLKCKVQFTYTKGTSKTISRHMQAHHGLQLNNSVVYVGSKKEAGKRAATASFLSKKRQRKASPCSPGTLVLKWLVGSFHPWRMIEDPGLSTMVSALVGCKALLPSLEELVKVAVRSQDFLLREFCGRLPFECTKFNLTIHSFTNSTGTAFSSVGIAYLDSHFQPQSMTLEVTEGFYDTTSLVAVLERFGLGTDQVNHVLLKGEEFRFGVDHADLKAALAFGSVCVDKCVVSKLNWIIIETVSRHPVIHEMIEALQQHYQTSQGWVNCIPGGATARVVKDYSIKTPTDMLNMLETFVSDESAVWTAKDMVYRALAPTLVAVLKPFRDATTTLSRDSNPSLGLSISVVRRIRAILDQIADNVCTCDGSSDAVLESFVQGVSSSLRNSFEENPKGLWTMPLDPRMVHMGGFQEEEKSQATHLLTSQLKDAILRKIKKQSKQQSTMGGIFFLHDEIDDTSRKSDTDISTLERETEAEAEAAAIVKDYFSAVKSSQRIDKPLEWWNSKQQQFPELAELARQWLCCSQIGPCPDARQAFPETENFAVVCFLHDNRDHLVDLQSPSLT